MSVHTHHREGDAGSRPLQWALGLTVTVMVVEFAAGLFSGSLALLADAGHMLTDAFALTLSLFAARMAVRPATSAKTYGYYRTEIVAALVNGVLLWLLVMWITARALHRLQAPPEVHSGPMLFAAALGLGANLLSARILSSSSRNNLNLRAALLHVLSDALGSCGVLVAAGLIRWRQWALADPIVSLVIAGLIALNSWMLIRQSVHVLLEGAPAHLDLARIEDAICTVAGIRAVHDLHVWTITTGLETMSGHLVVDRLSDGPQLLERLNALLAERFGVRHTTFQLELDRSSRDC